ncbi:hypothetical protein [Streptomyces sp. NBC_00009]|uniref:hypothetical protein n=1 Tax=Streptomyces sp. NBC_00009 TaxID=2975620 RepID=UPI003246AA13
MLLRLAYLTVTNLFAALRLQPMSDRDKHAEILALRHQLAVLERQLGADRVKFTAEDQAFLGPISGGVGGDSGDVPLPRAVLEESQQLAADTDRLLRAARQASGQLEQAGADMAVGEQQVRARLTRLDAERQELERAREHWGAAFPGEEWLAGPDDRAAMEARELSAPWMDPALASARTRLFLAALGLVPLENAIQWCTLRRCRWIRRRGGTR